jgi:hypothetical protein
MKKYWLAGAAALALAAAAAGYAWSQAQISAGGLSGAETVVVSQGGPGGPGIFTTTGRLSSGRSYAYFTAFPTASFTIGQAAAPTGTTVSTVNVAGGGDLLFNVTNGTAITITMPSSATADDGEIISICNVTTSAWATNAVTVAANTSQSITTVSGNSTTLTTLAAGTCNKWLWNATATTWFAMIGG